MSVHGILRGSKTPLLDHGYISYVEHWGSDERIVETARMSTDKGFLGWEPEYHYKCPRCGYKTVSEVKVLDTTALACPNARCGDGLVKWLELDTACSHRGDQKLLEYLYSHRHMTPFEFAGLTIEVQLPLFVRSEWERHRTQAYNEMSSRYVEMPELFYVPSVERLRNSFQDLKNKQGSRSILEPDNDTESLQQLDFLTGWQELIKKQCQQSFGTYKLLLSSNMAREVARTVLPVNSYTRLRATAKLRNWLEFMTLRADMHAQYEIQVYAYAVGDLLEQLFPRTFALWRAEKAKDEYQK